jgi:bacterioferritin-associated ferredoxin
LALIAEAAGLPAALTLAKARGGRKVTVPHRASGTKLAMIVGLEAAEKIIQAFGAGDLEIPLGPIGNMAQQHRALRAKIITVIETGASNSQVAGQCGVCVRTVKRVRARMREEKKHPDLFSQ